jgi:hypothetical protein
MSFSPNQPNCTKSARFLSKPSKLCENPPRRNRIIYTGVLQHGDGQPCENPLAANRSPVSGNPNRVAAAESPDGRGDVLSQRCRGALPVSAATRSPRGSGGGDTLSQRRRCQDPSLLAQLITEDFHRAPCDRDPTTEIQSYRFRKRFPPRCSSL